MTEPRPPRQHIAFFFAAVGLLSAIWAFAAGIAAYPWVAPFVVIPLAIAYALDEWGTE